MSNNNSRVFSFYKAQSISDKPIKEIIISIKQPLPENNILDKNDEIFKREGKELEHLLHTVLPGGTYDSLLIAFLERSISHLVVPHRENKG